MSRIKPSEFAGIAAQWGSLMQAGDPGACLYGFSESGLVQSEAHRQACLDYIARDCRRAADTNVAAGGDPAGQHPELDAMAEYLATAPVAGSVSGLDAFTSGYIMAALFSTNDGSDGSGGVPLDDNYGAEHISPETLAIFKADCARFQEFYGECIAEAVYTGCPPLDCGSPPREHAGIDFWFTRNGHGAGFWDGDWNEPAASVLTAASKSFGEFDLEVGDDGLIYGSGGVREPEKVTASPVSRGP
jgi:hypothetical protein